MAKQTWQELWTRGREIKTKGMAYLFERAEIYSKLCNDASFRAHQRQRANESGVAITVEQVLDDECEDINCRFTTLMNVLKRFPNKDDWGKMKLRDMIGQLFIEQKDREKKDREEARAIRQQAQKNQPSTKNNTTATAPAKSVEKTSGSKGEQSLYETGPKPSKEDRNSTYWALKDENVKLQSENAKLKAENAKLKAENAALKVEKDKMRAELNKMRRNVKSAKA